MSWTSTLIVLAAALGYGLAASFSPQATSKPSSALLGAKECLDGPSYWCQNFTTARQCNANQHCIRTVWEQQVLPPDNGEICETCKKMVAEAREELKSNETQENIKLVLEGSCMILIPIKPLARECVKMVDQAIPELIEAISSQMDPQMVCAIAGLCNSAHFDRLISEYKNNPKLDCDNCQVVSGMMEKNFRAASKDHVLNSMLEVCGKMGSFSDICASTLIVYFNSLYENLMTEMNPLGVCHLAGVCQQRYHNHSKEVEIKTKPQLEGDMPCELCEQLVQHLRDIMVANTTEKEFEQVLLGICLATKSFKKECVSMVETYYPVIYEFLTNELDGKFLCTQIGICPKTNIIHPLYPLLPVEVAETLKKDPKPVLHRVTLTKSELTPHSGSHSLQVSEAQLPLDSLVLVPHDQDLCQMCEYFLHFVQKEITDPEYEKEIMKNGEIVCQKLPDKFAPVCRSFVDTYTTALIAILAQDIDPSQVCPRIGVCPGFSDTMVDCAPCKTTSSLLLNNVGTNTTEDNIKKELLALCLTLPYEESRHCNQMIFSHSGDLTDMVTAEFTSDEMCFFMKYCTPTSSESTVIDGGDTETNNIPKTLEDEKLDGNNCVMCEFILKEVEQFLQDNKTEAEIRNIVEHICLVMPHTIRPKCQTFVDQYCDLVVTLLAQSVDPKEICTLIGACPSTTLSLEYVRMTLNKCVVCEMLMGALQGTMQDSHAPRDVTVELERACLKLPRSMRQECQDIVRQLAPQMVIIISEIPVGRMVCQRLKLCGHSQSVDLVSADQCIEGPTYWCQSTMHAATCEKIDYCQKSVWLADKPNKKSKIRAKKFIF